MKSYEIKQKFVELLINKYAHKEIPNASLVPENDPSVLFTTAGMHPLTVYLMGESHPQGKRLVNIQKSFRTDDIEVVGDTTHCTFFEMLGYWSLGDYFKEIAIPIFHEFLTSKEYLNLDINRLYVTVYEGDEQVPQDTTSAGIWKELFAKSGVAASIWNRKDFADSEIRVFPLPKKQNWWGPVGQKGPCGPDCEVFYWRGKGKPDFSKFVPWDDSTMFIEIGNDVFMEYNKENDGSFVTLNKKNVDFGGGLERMTLVTEFREEDGSVPMNYSVHDTDLFIDGKKFIEPLVVNSVEESLKIKAIRIILDHMRAIPFLISDGVEPSNKDQGYILRRLIRRVMRYAQMLGIEKSFMTELADIFVRRYEMEYPRLKVSRNTIANTISKEEIRFKKTLGTGLKEISKIRNQGQKLTGKTAFYVFESYGFPIEMTLDEFTLSEEDKALVKREFEEELAKHQDLSRSGAEKKFKGGLADQSETNIMYHTTTHLLQHALKKVLGDQVVQLGSNITNERLRLDFPHTAKLTENEIKEVENIINTSVEKKIPVNFVIMPKEDAIKSGAIYMKNETYPDQVKVYFVGDSLETAMSKEFCGGPHVKNTSELKPVEIYKQEKIGDGKLRTYIKFK